MGCGSCGSGASGKPGGCKGNGGCSTGGCNRLNVFDWLNALPLHDGAKPYPIIKVSFSKGSRKEFFKNNTHYMLEKGDWLAVEGLGGYDIGQVSLTGELVKLQDWVQTQKLKVVVLFEGRDSAGKGGAIKRITQRLNPRVCRVAALPAPNERERTQWYFQRYVTHLPAGGEIVLFDRSWYNRAGVERVMGFCTDAEYENFFRSVPEFERLLVDSGTILIKYWFSITDEEQEFRFNTRIHDPLKQWKLSPMDLEARTRWEDYTKAKEIMLERTHNAHAPWWVVDGVDKKRARLNCISHLLTQIPYGEISRPVVTLPERIHHPDYHRVEVPPEMYVPRLY